MNGSIESITLIISILYSLKLMIDNIEGIDQITRVILRKGGIHKLDFSYTNIV
jgi:hypothetical protein